MKLSLKKISILSATVFMTLAIGCQPASDASDSATNTPPTEETEPETPEQDGNVMTDTVSVDTISG